MIDNLPRGSFAHLGPEEVALLRRGPGDPHAGLLIRRSVDRGAAAVPQLLAWLQNTVTIADKAERQRQQLTILDALWTMGGKGRTALPTVRRLVAAPDGLLFTSGDGHWWRTVLVRLGEPIEALTFPDGCSADQRSQALADNRSLATQDTMPVSNASEAHCSNPTDPFLCGLTCPIAGFDVDTANSDPTSVSQHGSPSIRRDMLDEVVLDALLDRVLDPVHLEQLLAGLLERSEEADQRRRRQLAVERTSRTEAEKAIGNLLRLVENGTMPADSREVVERIAFQRARQRQTTARGPGAHL